MTPDSDCQQIIVLPERQGDLVALHRAYGDLEGEFFQSPTGAIDYRAKLDPDRAWHANHSLDDFLKSAAAFNRYCAGHGTPRDEPAFLREAARFRAELDALEPAVDPENSFWDSLLEQIEHGFL